MQICIFSIENIHFFCLETALPASPGSHSFSTSFTETYNHESYLLANNRLKFKAVKNKIDIAANDSRKGRAKKPRKGTRGLGGNKVDNLPERGNSNFSVTKETVKASETCLVVDVHDKKHETEILEHFKNNIVPDFPRWMSFMWYLIIYIIYYLNMINAIFDSFIFLIIGKGSMLYCMDLAQRHWLLILLQNI